MKIVELNVWYWKMEKEIEAFLEDEQPDVVFLVEVADGILSRGESDYPLERIAKELGYELGHAKAYSAYNEDKQYGSYGVAILSKYSIIEELTHYVPYLGGYREYRTDTPGVDVRTPPTNWRDRLRTWTFHRQAPSPVCDVQINYQGTPVRLICTHFKPSEKCTETYQMLKHVQYLEELLGFYSNLPTIVGGDFNIGKNAIVLQPLYEQLEHLLDEEINTLNPRIHPGFTYDIPPSGYHVDHILHKGCNVQSAYVPDVDVSDHLPVVGEVEVV